MVTDQMVDAFVDATRNDGWRDHEDAEYYREQARSGLDAALSAAEPVATAKDTKLISYVMENMDWSVFGDENDAEVAQRAAVAAWSRIRSALSAQVQDVAGPVAEIVPYKGTLSSLSNGRDLKLNIPIVNLPIGMKLYATPPSPLAAVKALEFYANPENWIDTPSWDGDPDCITPKAIPVIDDGDGARPCDCGDTARDALTALYAQGQNVADSPAIKAIAAERARQIEKEGWSPAHDDKYINGELLEAAACYALHNVGELDDAPGAWPWSRDFWKPTTRQRDLEKAGALIAAELDRVIRAAAPAKQEGKP